MNVSDWLQLETQTLKDAGIPDARTEVERLLANELGWQREQLYTRGDVALTEDARARLGFALQRRLAGEPLAYILGHQGFYKHDFKVSSDVLIPRPETELVVELALEWLRKHRDPNEPVLILDLGAGSGCIGLSIIKEWPMAQLVAIDVSPKALQILEENAKLLGVSERTSLLCRDVQAVTAAELEPILGPADPDLIVANPPYIERNDPHLDPAVQRYEPELALYSEEGGLAHLRAWAEWIQKSGRSDLPMFFEIGWQQGDKVQLLLENFGGFRDIEIHKDLQGHSRVVSARRSD